MALIKCPECGKEISSSAASCPNCGHPIVSQTHVDVSVTTPEKYRGPLSGARLAIGIISIILFVFVMFQSCAAGVSNTLQENGSVSGSQGVLTAICLLVAGIVGICTRNSRSKAGSIITTIFYLLGALMTVGSGETYGDLPIWGAVCLIFSVVFLISAIKTKKK